MRGAPDPDRSLLDVGGIIPADAGSTSAGPLTYGGIQDHPRGCGEHFK